MAELRLIGVARSTLAQMHRAYRYTRTDIAARWLAAAD
jgi:hypothetical protein